MIWSSQEGVCLIPFGCFPQVSSDIDLYMERRFALAPAHAVDERIDGRGSRPDLTLRVVMVGSTESESSAHKLIAFSVGLYLLLCAVLLAGVLIKTQGHLVYSLDDPYIHLALAENIAKGHYGINLNEYSSPSSSVLWPFLLVPFAGTHLHVYVPLFWNILFGVVAAWVIGKMVAKWPAKAWWQPYVLATFLVLIANLDGLTLIGMEHVLQVTLSICAAYGVIEALHDRPVPMWCIVAAAVAPMVRYEDLAVTLAVACALVGVKRWKAAAVMFGVSLVPLIAFSVFLKSRGMPALPMSVLAKGHDFAQAGSAGGMLSAVRMNLVQDVTHVDHFSTVVLFVIFVWLTARAKTTLQRWCYGGVAALGLLQLTIGRFGWFHRYEVYALIFMLAIALSVYSESRKIRFVYVAVPLLCCAAIDIQGMVVTPSSSEGIYLQQYQMNRFVANYYQGDFAVNDLGLVSFQRRPGSYVLASRNVPQRAEDRTEAWLAEPFSGITSTW
jgi:hypothetical protein